MKHLFFAILLVFGTFTLVNAQNCKYKKNGIDKFTNKFTKVTKSEKVIGTFTTSGAFSAEKIENSYYFIFDYDIIMTYDFEPYSIKQGAELIFLLENGETITLNSDDNIYGTKMKIGTLWNCSLSNVSYQVTSQQLDMFLKFKVKSTRFYRSESNGKEDYIDNEIKRKNQDDMQNLIKCIL